VQSESTAVQREADQQAIETILEKYAEIFVEEDGEQGQSEEAALAPEA